MTRADWDANMQRYMHRSDIAADLDQVWEFATTTFFNQWMNKDGRTLYANDDALLAAAPSPLHHAGLMYFHELAQDEEGLMRENSLFGYAMADFVMNYSIRNIDPVMTRPYFDQPGETA